MAFSAEVDGIESLFWQAADESGGAERLTTTTIDRQQGPSSFSPDGKLLVFAEPVQPPFDLYALQIADRKVLPLLNTAVSESNGEISPNGRWLLYQSDESGANEIYVRPFPKVAEGFRSQVSSAGGTRPMWARDGREIFYLAADGSMMVAPVDSNVGSYRFSAGTPKMLFSTSYYVVQAGRSYDVSRDGNRFLMIKSSMPQTPSITQLVVTLNWTEELKRLVPGK